MPTATPRPPHCFAGLTTIVYSDGAAPAALRQKLTAFAEAGGLLVVTAPWGKVSGEKISGLTVAPLGKDIVASDDPRTFVRS